MRPFGGGLLDDVLDLGVVQLAFGLALELRVGEAHRDDGGQALAHVVAGEVGVTLFEDVGLAGVVVEGAGEGAAEAGEVRAAVNGVDVVGEGEDRLGEAVVVLQGDLGDRGARLCARCRWGRRGPPCGAC